MIAVPENPCDKKNMTEGDLHCLTCDGADTDDDCRESGVYTNCDSGVRYFQCHPHMNVHNNIALLH